MIFLFINYNEEMGSKYKFYIFYIVVYFNKVASNILENGSKHSVECNTLIENFALASANFMFCTLQHARPVQICCYCVAAYNTVLENYDVVTKKNVNTSTCDETLINQDRIEVIKTSFEFIENLWSKGQCNNCFENKSKPFEPSNTTKEFNNLYSSTNQCLQSHYNTSSKTYSPDVCQNCSSMYYKMNKFYFNVKEITGNGNICMDIVDIMNITQHLWSNVLHCGETTMNFERPLLIIITFILLLPVSFYLLAWKFTKTSSSDVLHHNRLSQRFGERWRNRTVSSISN